MAGADGDANGRAQHRPEGPEPPADPGAAPAAGNKSRAILIVGVLFAAVALVLGLAFIVGDGDGDGDQAAENTPPTATAPGTDLAVTTDVSGTTVAPTTLPATTTSDPGFTQAEGEIFLEPAGSEGPDSYTGEVFVTPTTTTESSSTSSIAPAPAPTGPTTVTGEVGDTPGLYGGTRNNAVCDKAAQLRFLQDHADKAAAWVEALNGDPTLRWSGGTSLAVAQLPDYFAELTPMVLTRDTRVTNHGYRDGRPTSRQVVLQAGTAVLVDAYGVPRARCLCGNPLTAPQPVRVTPVYAGNSWPDFNPETIVVVNPTTVVIEIFVLVDVTTGEEFTRPAGSDGRADGFREASTWRIDVEATLAEADYFNTTTASWSGEFTIAADETISGIGTGTWTFDADCYASSGEVQSTDSSQGSFTVNLSGQATTTELGRFVSIQTAYSDFAIGSVTGNPPIAECEQDIYNNVESWVAPSFTTIESLQAEGDSVLASYESNGFTGSVTLTPIG